ncbi:transcription elongation factor GreA [Egibacter rhizosphaerae]|uniref:Transcription elongation factor GreA n=1 Tax=Egibacter rhizosphaerae TaxID=1670831 RepID=A0A411YIK9_9ACTN|nr:transcription elongation factor GreA [Egibacter rhizosphaerae]QBI21145.1 transcription elongation factor GreA [Egibacter rhizosphaerae]
MSDDPVWLSQEAYDRLVAELEHLKTEGRREASEAIEKAREHGDLKENAEYDVAKDEQGKMELRIRQLEDMLARAEVGDAPEGDVVAAGTVVTTVDSDGDRDEYLLGSIEDKAEGLRVISTGSPLGKALLGARVGDTVTYDAPAGELSIKVEDVRPYEGA